MGGCTITKTGKNLETILTEMTAQVKGASAAGLWADSELVVIDPAIESARIFKVKYEFEGEEHRSPVKDVKFTEVTKGRAFHVGVAGRFGPKPTLLESWVGTIHVHT